jgi:hypothetical protein
MNATNEINNKKKKTSKKNKKSKLTDEEKLQKRKQAISESRKRKRLINRIKEFVETHNNEAVLILKSPGGRLSIETTNAFDYFKTKDGVDFIKNLLTNQ